MSEYFGVFHPGFTRAAWLNLARLNPQVQSRLGLTRLGLTRLGFPGAWVAVHQATTGAYCGGLGTPHEQGRTRGDR